ncbi:hypothetical protein WBG99_33000 [Streptomyces sp. TG1A-60]|uniref:hypothetical protein n=1 Tax=Streptomyces sp. TG1A-60 TaxID=3129111 RepID=UPI0030D019BA
MTGKFSVARRVWTPPYASAGTARSPSRPCSLRVTAAVMAVRVLFFEAGAGGPPASGAA